MVQQNRIDVLDGCKTEISVDEEVFRLRLANSLPIPSPRPKLLDLFSGAGGLTLGFTRRFDHSFEPIWANDIDPDCRRTYVANFGDHCHPGDIGELHMDDPQIPDADVVVGGPPCQGFSLLNKARNGDPRRQLWRPFLDIVSRVNATVFVMENVPQLLGTAEHDQILKESSRMGYQVSWAKLCAADYGVPQNRWRAFIIGCKTQDPKHVFPPRKTHRTLQYQQTKRLGTVGTEFISQPGKRQTVRDAIADLPFPEGTEIRSEDGPLDLHFGRSPTVESMKRYRIVSEQGMNRFDLQRLAPELTPDCWLRKKSGGTDLFGRLWWDRPALTIRTEFFKPEKGRYLHPEQHRPLSHREAARLQSFPDDFLFVGSKISIARQIGNAVPPMLAARIADCVYSLLYIPLQ